MLYFIKAFILFVSLQGRAYDYKNCQNLPVSDQSQTEFDFIQCSKLVQQTPSFLVVKTKYENLPGFIKEEFGQFLNVNNWDRVFVSITTVNDDFTKKDSISIGGCKIGDKGCADDAGFTVGSSISLGGIYNGHDVRWTLGNALYSKKDPKTYWTDKKGITHAEQYFRSEIFLEFLMNSARQKELFFWTIGGGLVALSSEESFGMLDAAVQQREVHKIFNALSKGFARTYTNRNDGQKDVWGVYLLTGLGIQHFLHESNTGINGRVYAQILPRISTLNNHSNLRLELGVEFTKSLGGRHRIGHGGEIASTLHGDGTLHESTVYVMYGYNQKLELRLGMTCYRGRLQNYATYNIPNPSTQRPDCMYQIRGKYYL